MKSDFYQKNINLGKPFVGEKRLEASFPKSLGLLLLDHGRRNGNRLSEDMSAVEVSWRA